ncbi:hypothetical protein [Streptomyces sp. NBC_00989]|uniref:hypothetical protein n=1 Tax=Streptomyces sp. NBC_00989 TaxID=2903705 RepID=UPI0038666FD2|nr:hypothetical protein OG714_51165 [Streptomyces sp. NBC_00989]
MLLTGDEHRAAARLAAEVGIAAYRSTFGTLLCLYPTIVVALDAHDRRLTDPGALHASHAALNW